MHSFYLQTQREQCDSNRSRNKDWDLVVLRQKTLTTAVVEVRIHIPSFIPSDTSWC